VTRALRLAAALGLLAALSAPRPAPAQPYDPRLDWRTLETEHFRIHYHGGLGALARRVAGAAERAHALLVPAFAPAPATRTEVVLSDDSDDANGSATPLPYDTIRLFAVPPAALSELNDERDWVEGLVTHEYVHILHLDRIEGWPRAVNAVFGKLLAPSAFSPSLVIEGLAVLHEGDGEAGGDGGRNANALFDMYARALAVEGPFPRLDEVVHQPLTWPRGNLAYLLGGRFFLYLRQRCGAEALTAFMQDQGAQLWPYRFDTLARRHLGADLATLWGDFGAAVRARAEAELAAIRARPVTQARPLTRRGSQVLHPRWLPDGTGLVYFDAGTEERPGLRRVGLDGRDGGRLADVDANGTFALRSSREAVVAATEVWREFSTYDDLRLVDLEAGGQRQLTDGERATDPDVSPDGATVVYAVHLPGGEMALRRRRLAGGPAETLFQREGVQVSAPRLSPDGRQVAFELQENGRRDLALLQGGQLSFVTDDDAIDLGPSWSPDGRTLYFASERSGVYNVYAYEIEATSTATSPTPTSNRHRAPGRLWQVTNLELGALEPQLSPDGATLAFVGYSRRGYDLYALPLDRSSWTEPAPPQPRPLRGPDAARTPPPPTLPDRPYRAFDTALPTFWLPTLGIDGAGTTLGVVTGGSDVLLQHLYLAQGWYGFASRQPGYDVAYLGTWLYPRLQLSSARFIDTTPGFPERLEEAWVPLEASATFTDTRLTRSTAFTVGWRALRLRALGGVPQVFEPGVAAYRDGTASEWSASLAYSDARRFVSSISPEEGRVLSLGVSGADASVGGTFTYARARASIAQYLRVPGTSHVVLATRASLGVARGTLGGRQPFTLGGPAGEDPVSLALAAFLGPIVPGDVLRGYPSGALAGSTLENGSLELRFPLAVLERGYRAWPVQLRRLHGALFLDAGQLVPAPPSGGAPFGALGDLHFGAGGELRAEVVLGYALRTDLRLGLARGLGQLLRTGRPSDPDAVTQLYLTLGPSF
jgi:Tol biopolymer transport system component